MINDYTKKFKSENINECKELFIQTCNNLILCEAQEEHYCGRHVLRAVTQRFDLFDDEYLINIAKNIAKTEQSILDGKKVKLTDYVYERTGYYDIQILKSALLKEYKTDLFQIQPSELTADNIQKLILSNIQKAQAFVIHEQYHYYCLRRFRSLNDYFFKINSKCPTHHQTIHSQNILSFFDTLWNKGANVYVALLYVCDDLSYHFCENNIETILWPFPHAAADRESVQKIS